MFYQQSWSGSAAGAAERKVDSHVETMEQVDKAVNITTMFLNDAYDKTVIAKNAIHELSYAAQDAIDKLALHD